MAKLSKPKKPKKIKIDGLGPDDLKKIRNAVRQIWQRSHPRKLVVSRSTDKDGFPFCELCKKRVPKAKIDHITPVGDLLNGGIERMFVPSKGLQALCDACHRPKTNAENKARRVAVKKAKKALNEDDLDFM